MELSPEPPMAPWHKHGGEQQTPGVRAGLGGGVERGRRRRLGGGMERKGGRGGGGDAVEREAGREGAALWRHGEGRERKRGRKEKYD